jgi:hypothetical protein
MNDKIFDHVIALAALALGVYVYLYPKISTNTVLVANDISTPNNTMVDPNLINFLNQTAANGGQPIAYTGAPVNVNIANQGLNYLDQKVMPMFGFVGMAQGQNY